MALVTVWLVCRNRSDLPGEETAVRIVAVDARHGALRQLVGERLLKGRPYVVMAGRAHLIHFRVLPRVEMVESLVHRVTRRARHGVFHMRAADPPNLCALIEVTFQAVLVG